MIKSLTLNMFCLQVFISFAKDQTDDCLTDVIISNGLAQSNFPARLTSPAVLPQPPVTPTQQRKSPLLPEKSPEINSTTAKARRTSSSKSHKEKGGSISMSRLTQAQKMGSSGSNSSSGSNIQGESSKSHGSKRKAENSSKDPSALFIVSNSSQDSSL